MFPDELIKGNLMSPDRMLLWNIQLLLREQNELLKSIFEQKQVEPDEDKKPRRRTKEAE